MCSDGLMSLKMSLGTHFYVKFKMSLSQIEDKKTVWKYKKIQSFKL